MLFYLHFIGVFCPQQYPYRDMDGSKVVLHLIHITINTLNAQYHSCRPHATAGPLYSDNSNMSRYSEKEKGEAEYQQKNATNDYLNLEVTLDPSRKEFKLLF